MLTSLLTLGARWTLVGGKGGVGKTTTAAALAVEMADRGERVLVISVDPAHSLGDALGIRLAAEAAPVPGAPNLEALEVDPDLERSRFLDSRRGPLLSLIERGTYLEQADVEGVLDLAVPGMDELAALLRLRELAAAGDVRVVIDTAPTGHALRLLELPHVARGWVEALRAMEEKHRSVSLALVGAYRPGEAAAMLDALDAELAAVTSLLTDPERTRFVLVTNSEPVVLAETRRYQSELEARGIAIAGVLVNRAGGASEEAVGEGTVYVPRLAPEPWGVEGARAFAAAARSAPPAASRRPTAARAHGAVGGPYVPPLDKSLYLIGGKGGVGKSTSAAALGILLATRREGTIHLMSTDPAGSLGDVLGISVGSEPAPVPEHPRLLVRQIDASAAWDDFRRRYRDDTERLFEGLLAGGLSAVPDQRVIERLVDLAPPGIDELVALLEVVDAAEGHSYDALVLDTAPTGHLLRLLEMPEVVQEWTRTLMRLLLKYREVFRLGELAERVVQLSRSLRELRALLADPGSTWLLVVALPEGLSVDETRRLLPRLRALDVPVGALLVNRAMDARGALRGDAAPRIAELAGLDPDLAVAGAPDLERPPVGAAALLEFIGAWRTLG